jgi:nucleoside phosphorylase
MGRTAAQIDRDFLRNKMYIKRFCVVTAHDLEFKTAAGLLSDSRYYDDAQVNVCQGSFGNLQVTVLKSGVGAFGFANRLSAHLQNNRYEALMVAGVAGALDPQIKTGDAVVFNKCYNARADRNGSHSGDVGLGRGNNAVIACDDKLSQFVAEGLRSSGATCFRGAGVTVDRIITSAREKVALGKRYLAAAVDMETYDCLSVCAHFGLSATALRVVSDDAVSDLPDFNRALIREGREWRMSKWRMASAIMINPINSARFLLSISRVLDSLRTNLNTIYSASGRRELDY